MERLILEKLIKWKQSNHRKPLILKGARQVGKTYILKQFGKENYEGVAYFNFDHDKDLYNLFENTKNPKRILEQLAFLYGKAIIPGKTLIIFDEIQECPNALNSLKYLSNIPDDLPIISENVLKPIIDLKMSHFGSKRPKLRADEILLALSITATTSPVAKRALDHLEELRFCEAHSSKILSVSDEKILKRLNVNLTCSPNLRDENKIFHE